MIILQIFVLCQVCPNHNEMLEIHVPSVHLAIWEEAATPAAVCYRGFRASLKRLAAEAGGEYENVISRFETWEVRERLRERPLRVSRVDSAKTPNSAVHKPHSKQRAVVACMTSLEQLHRRQASGSSVACSRGLVTLSFTTACVGRPKVALPAFTTRACR